MSIGIGNCSLGFVPRVALAIADDVNPAQVNECLAAGVDLVEFRVDLFADNSVEKSCTYLKAFSDISSIGTIRSKKEGGNWSGDEKARCALYKEIISFVNAVDIEIGASDIVDDVVKKAKQSDVTVIGSYHNFVNTPMPDVLTGILEEGKDLGVDIVKIATHCANADDLCTLTQFLVNHPEESLIVIGMGASGGPSRIFFPFLGSLITYTFLGSPSAPGQFGWEETLTLIKKVSFER